MHSALICPYLEITTKFLATTKKKEKTPHNNTQSDCLVGYGMSALNQNSPLVHNHSYIALAHRHIKAE